MSDARASEVLAERPDLEPALRAVRRVDDDREAWTFDDVPVDSGAFGELVSAGLVEKIDEGYRLADPADVRAALDGGGAADEGGERGISLGNPLERVERAVSGTATADGRAAARRAAPLAAALAFLLVSRLLPWGAVFRDGAVVLSGNDPYYYRYWVELVAGRAAGPFDPVLLTDLPSSVAHGEALLVASLSWVTVLLGGGARTAGLVLAWYPVVSAVVTGALLYLFAARVADDRRVGLAAVAVLAVIPGHAMRTSLGFADHHAFDYPWLVLTALGLLVLVGDRTERPTPRHAALGALAVGAGVAGQALAWDAGPLLLVPVAAVVVGRVLLDVRAGRSPVSAGGPVLAGLTLAAALAAGAHVGLGWHSPEVGLAPAALLVGAVGVVLAGEAAVRAGVPARPFAAGLAGAGVAGLAALRFGAPDVWRRFARHQNRLFARRDIAEMQSLFGDSWGWLLLLGFALLLAFPYLVWSLRRVGRGDGGWLVAATYGWYTFLLAAVQVRFVGEFGAFVALFAGLGFVHLANRIDVTAPPAPFAASSNRPDGGRTRRERALSLPSPGQAGALVVLFLLVGSLGMVQVPVKNSQLTIPDDQYETADWLATYADDQGREYPENYVLSRWGRNRVFNYFVNGQSESYGYAYRTYCHFVTTGAPSGRCPVERGPDTPSTSQGWYDAFEGRVGFVVLHPLPNAPDSSMYARLFRGYGSKGAGNPAVSHFRLVYRSDTTRYRAFEVVPGATITGTAAPNATVGAKVRVTVGDESFDYVQTTETGPNGSYAMTVPYAGEYVVGEQAANGTQVTVPEAAVTEGRTVEA